MSATIRNRIGFTLPELLVVIVIIVILVGLLLPAISSAKAKAQAAKCTGNLRQLGIATQTYVADHGVYPVGIDASGPGERVWVWQTLVRSTMHNSQNTEVFRCPTAPLSAQWIPKFGSGLPARLGYLQDEVRMKPGGVSFMSYGYNVWGAFTHKTPNLGLGVFLGDKIWGETKEAEVVKPSEMIAFGDSNWDVKRKGDTNWSGFIGMYEERQWPLELHKGRAEIIFCDGHVEPKKRPEIIGQLQTETSLRDAAAKQWNRDNQPHFE